jgi:glycosyltransferase involved in cell wall biosynthesis
MLSYLDFPKLLAAADVVAIPQLDTEATRYQMPMKVYDCMAMAKPIVASAISDLPPTLEGCGRLVPPGQVAPLAAAIADLLNNPETARALGAKARARCLENYSMAAVGKKLASVIEKLTEARQS